MKNLILSTIATSVFFLIGLGQAPIPIIEVIGYPGQNPMVTAEVPFTLYAHAMSSELNGKTQVKTLYEWNYGDYTAASTYNRLEGWTGAHLYREPGNYTVTLTVTDEDNLQSTTTISVVLTASTRQNIYLSSSTGNDSNDGLSPTSPKQSLEEAMLLITDNTVLNILRGDTINTFDYQINLNNRSNVVIQPYGLGTDKPVFSTVGLLEASDSNPPHITLSNCSQIVILDLLLTSEIPPEYHVPFSTPWNGIFCNDPNSSEISVVDCEFEHIGFCIATWNLTGLLMQNNTAERIGKYLHYGLAEHGSFLGNICDAVLDGYGIRAYGGPWNISHNTLWTDADELMNQEPLGGIGIGTSFSIALAGGSHYYVAKNTTLGPWMVGHWVTTVETASNSVLDGNVTYRYSHYDPTLRIFHGNDNIMIRNNVFHLNDNDINTEAIRLEEYGSGYPGDTGVVATTWIYHNTFISESDMSTFINIGANPNAADTFFIANNLSIFPDLDGGHSFGWDPFMVTANEALGNVVFGNNLWQEPTSGQAFRINGNFITPMDWEAIIPSDDFHLFTTTDVDFLLNNDFSPSVASPANDFCPPIAGVHKDLHGTLRSTILLNTAGAAENGIWSVDAVDNYGENTIGIYPNPASQLITLQSEYMGLYDVVFFNLHGQVVLKTVLEINQEEQLDVSILEDGIYIIELSNRNNTSIEYIKFLKK